MTERFESSRSNVTLWSSFRSRVALPFIGLCVVFAGFGATDANAAPTPMVDLGAASSYAVFSGASVANTVSAPGAPHTTVRGDLGVKANTEPTGFPPGVVTGTTRIGTPADSAHAAVVSAYSEIDDRTGGAPLAGALVGVTVGPGLHTISGAASNTGTLTLDGGGDPDAVFVFQVDGALAFAAGSRVLLTNGARASRVFWQVNGAGAVGALAEFTGTLIASAAVGIGNGTLVNGRAFARDGALTLDNNQIYSAPPVLTIDGGLAAQTTDTTPTISGTTDVEAPGMVHVTIADQNFDVAPTGGTWSVTSGLLANGTYPVTASAEDGAGNPGSAIQQLTVDTVPPEITLEGGESVTTNNPTPTIAGTSDVAAVTVVQVTVDSQVLYALVDASGSWSVRAGPLADGTHDVTAAVSDPAGNESTDTQLLTIDTIAPTLSISGGAVALTKDPTPEVSGTTDLSPGSTVTVDVGNETLTALVGGGGTWEVTASTLSDGPHRFVVSVEDAAGNPASAQQMLTVDTVAPLVAIDGGANATTEDVSPTITGTSDAAPGSTVTVSIASQTLTTLLQSNHTWNINPGVIGDGAWQVVASAQDPAGNVGMASQALTIGPPPVAPEKRTLTVTKTGNGSGTVTSTPEGVEFDDGTVVTLAASPTTGSSFVDWDGACSGSSASCTVTMDQARTVSASFADKPPVINKLEVAPKKIRLSGRSRSAMRRRGPAIKLNLTEDSKVKFRITRRFTRTRIFQLRVKGGSSSVRVPAKIRKKIKRGNYRLIAVATDSAGQTSNRKGARFRAVR